VFKKAGSSSRVAIVARSAKGKAQATEIRCVSLEFYFTSCAGPGLVDILLPKSDSISQCEAQILDSLFQFVAAATHLGQVSCIRLPSQSSLYSL